nr:alpha/beta hydrolase [Mammaliicoccus sp. Marseille-Q6498]
MGVLITRDSKHLVYEKHGNGSPLIMLHGLNMNLATFKTTVEKLKDDYTIYTIDSRGHGKSDKPLEFSIQQHINDIMDLMELEQIESANILGHDMGGLIAQELAIQQPEKVRKLVLVSTISNQGKQPLIRLIAKHRDKVAGFSKEEAMLILFNEIFYDVDSTFKWYQEVKKYHRMTVEEDAISVRSINGINIRAENVNLPTLIIKGKHDPFTVDDDTEAIKDAQLEIFEHSGHAPFIEEEEKFINVVTTFLKEPIMNKESIS